MRKAKLMLSAIAVLAVVGGAFAFKANRSLITYYVGTTSTTLPTRTIPQATASNAPRVNATLYYYTTISTAKPILTGWVYTTGL